MKTLDYFTKLREVQKIKGTRTAIAVDLLHTLLKYSFIIEECYYKTKNFYSNSTFNERYIEVLANLRKNSLDVILNTWIPELQKNENCPYPSGSKELFIYNIQKHYKDEMSPLRELTKKLNEIN